MLSPFNKNENQDLDRAIAEVMQTMQQCSPSSEEYSIAINHLERLYALKMGNHRARVSPDTMVLVMGNLLGILIIVAYEQKNVIGSKALGLIMKVK